MSAHLVSKVCYQQLIESLQCAVPRSLSIIGSLRSVTRGKLIANFYVDKWPDYNAVVCQYIWPRRSDVCDIGAYARSSEALLSVLINGDLVTWGRRQEFQRIEDCHADYLIQHLQCPGAPPQDISLKCIHERTSLVYHQTSSFGKLFAKRVQGADKVILPEGLVQGRLLPHHADLVASVWPRLHDWPNKKPYFKELISSYFCPAVFSTEDLDCPVSFFVEFPCGQAFGWTDDKYRRNNFVSVNALAMDLSFPWESELFFPKRVKRELDSGAVLSGYNVKDLVIDKVLCKL